MVKESIFREDLLFRVQTISIHLPPLRDRKEDVREIALHHINKTCKLSGEPIKGFSPDFFETLANYTWPGNIRELLNTLDKVMSDAFDEPTLFPRHLPTKIRAQAARRHVKGAMPSKAASADKEAAQLKTMQAYLDEVKKKYVMDLMQYVDRDIRRACAVSGLSRSHLYQLLKKFEIQP